MKLCRFQPMMFEAPSHGSASAHPAPLVGRIDGTVVREMSGDPFSNLQTTDRTWPLEDVKLLPPVVPSKIVCVGRNYLEHANELGNEMPKYPLIFLKPPSSIIATDEPIVMPAVSKRVDYEGEIGLVIGKRCSWLGDNESATPYIAGLTCVNDVTARDLQNPDGQWTRAKGFDTFCPIGPFLETEFDFGAMSVETFVNGNRKQSGRTSEMMFSVDVILRWISRVMTLEPGDVIATGTPSGVGPLVAGEVVEVVVSGVGTLRNPVVGPDA
jgi:2-keto-4-pentenoate hydratase/2-oxohepta-3-ene-1,7-dioic acid hydratase in catechol pathway